MPYFAQLNDADIAVAVTETHDTPAGNLVELTELDSTVLGKHWDGTDWGNPPANGLPELVVTNLQCDDTNALIQPGDVTCVVGSTVTATVTLTDASGYVVPLTATFRMPLVARDGRERVLLVKLDAGVATISVPLRESGVWIINEQSINAGLPPTQQMHIATQSIYVTETG